MDWERARIESAVRKMLERDRFRVSGELRMVVLTALWEYLDRRTRDHPMFMVDEWSGTGTRTRIFAGCIDRDAAQAAFDVAKAKWPNSRFTLRNGARVVRDWPEQS